MEGDGKVGGGVLSPVEVEACYLLDCLAGEGDGDGLAGVGEGGLPFCEGSAVDSGEGELARFVQVWGGNGKALGDVAGDCGDVGDVAVLEGEGSVWW